MDLDIIEPEVQDFSVFRGNSGVSLFLLSFKQKVLRVLKLWQWWRILYLHLCISICICMCMNIFSSLNLRGHFGQNIWCHGRQIWTNPEVWSGSYFNLSQKQTNTLLWQYVRVWQKWSDSFFRCALADMFRYVKQAVQFLFPLFPKELCHWKFSTQKKQWITSCHESTSSEDVCDKCSR